MIAAGTFREDLYYRLAEIVVRIPALRERPGDPALLARHFLNRFAKDVNPPVKGLAPDALAARDAWGRSAEHTSEVQSLMRIAYAVSCLTQKKKVRRCNKKSTDKN